MCAAPELEERVDRLETILGQFIVQTNTAINRMERDTRLLKQEMREFKNEMRTEMKEFKDEMRADRDEMKADRDESKKIQ
ncbi:MAG: hypothetical protein HC887_06650, partial [Desulfobacteraceae bacterium]|nr:hypothetical protein [Desulfobacteraceae bacterium]